MEITHAVKLAQDLIRENNLNLQVVTSKTKSSVGRCFFWGGRATKIELSEPWVEVLDEQEVKDTILHEIAHAVAGLDAGHGLRWKTVAMSLGARPSTCAKIDKEVVDKFNQKNAKYHATCPCGKASMYFNRMGKNWQQGKYKCVICGKQAIVQQLR